MNIEIRQLTDWSLALDIARFSVHKDMTGKEPSRKWIQRQCFSEHSMLYEVKFLIISKELPTWVVQHVTRHDEFAHHTVRDTKETYTVATQRNDRAGNSVDRNKLPQDYPSDHLVVISAMDLIQISRRRLCNCASAETKRWWWHLIQKLAETQPELASVCVPNCIYRGRCPEFNEDCHYVGSDAWVKRLGEYNKAYDYACSKNT